MTKLRARFLAGALTVLFALSADAGPRKPTQLEQLEAKGYVCIDVKAGYFCFDKRQLDQEDA